MGPDPSNTELSAVRRRILSGAIASWASLGLGFLGMVGMVFCRVVLDIRLSDAVILGLGGGFQILVFVPCQLYWVWTARCPFCEYSWATSGEFPAPKPTCPRCYKPLTPK